MKTNFEVMKAMFCEEVNAMDARTFYNFLHMIGDGDPLLVSKKDCGIDLYQYYSCKMCCEDHGDCPNEQTKQVEKVENWERDICFEVFEEYCKKAAE